MVNEKSYDAVFFDMDGVIFDSIYLGLNESTEAEYSIETLDKLAEILS